MKRLAPMAALLARVPVSPHSQHFDTRRRQPAGEGAIELRGSRAKKRRCEEV
jgi:hypothetical protein